jgi:hypothetical protein
MLFMWLFSLGACLANASLSPAPADATGHLVAQRPEAVAPDSDAAGDEDCHQDQLASSAQGGMQGHHGTSAKTNCQDFCGKATVSIPPLKSALDDVQAHALVATVFTTTALPVLPFTSLQPWVPRRDGERAPPILIAYLRLTL